MSQQKEKHHKGKIVEQFSRQAIPFTQVPGHLDSIQILIEMVGVTGKDNVLDVACGPGLVACEFARYAKQVKGVDITPAMIEQAEARQRQLGLKNLNWVLDDVAPLPFVDNSFSLVITRYSFHHFLTPQNSLYEMIRVSSRCKSAGGGRGDRFGQIQSLRSTGTYA